MSMMSILVVLPIKKFMKHNIEDVEEKVKRVQQAWDLPIIQKSSWQIFE